MAEVELDCAVYGEGTMFSVKIAGDAEVEALQEAIADRYRVVINRVEVYPATLTLYLAKKKGAWLKSDHTLKPFLKKRRKTNDEYVVEMIPNWKLSKKEYFGDFQLGEEVIHVLVELPTQVAAPSDVIPSLPSTTIHRHPERLKRWAAINAMIRQKNQDANQKTTTEDAKNTNKKRKNHDIDKSVGYATLCWEDIKPIYNFDDSYDYNQAIFLMPTSSYSSLVFVTCGNSMDKSTMGKKPRDCFYRPDP